MSDAEQALIVAAYKFAGVPDPERLAAAFLAQVKREPPRETKLERMPRAEGPAARFTLADRWDYTNAELREIAREQDIPVPSRLTHDKLVRLLAGAGIDLPAKPLRRA